MFCEKLKQTDRTLRTMPGKQLLGPTGARLRADYLDPVCGFSGRIDFVHKMNIPLLFKVEAIGPDYAFPKSTWYPDRTDLELTAPDFKCSESKWISWEDAAVSIQTWRNESGRPLTLRLTLP